MGILATTGFPYLNVFLSIRITVNMCLLCNVVTCEGEKKNAKRQSTP